MEGNIAQERPKDSLEQFELWYEEAMLDPPVTNFKAAFGALVADASKNDETIVDAVRRTVPKCVKRPVKRAEFAATLVTLAAQRPSLIKQFWNEACRLTNDSWSVPDTHIFYYLLLCELYLADSKGQFRKEDPLCFGLERCNGKTRPAEGSAEFTHVLRSVDSSWENFEKACLAALPVAPRSRAIYAMCSLAKEMGVAPGKFIMAYVDAVFTAKGSLEEDVKMATWAFSPLLKSLSTEDVTTLLTTPVGRALRLTTEKSLPAALLLASTLDCNIIPDECMLIPSLKALRTSSKETVQDLASKLVGLCLTRASEASCGGVLKELCEELPREGSFYRRTKMIAALSTASPRASTAWSKMVFATLLKRAKDEKIEETKLACLEACLSWISPYLSGEVLDPENEAILASKACHSVTGLRVIRLVIAEMKVSTPTKEQIVRDVSQLIGGADVDYRLKLHGVDALVTLGSKTSASKLDLTKVNKSSEIDCLAAVRLLSKFEPDEGTGLSNYFLALGMLLAAESSVVHQEARRVCEARVVTVAREKDMMYALAKSGQDLQLTKLAIVAMLPPTPDQCDNEHLALALCLSFHCAAKLRKLTWLSILKRFPLEARKDSFKFSAPLLFAGDRPVDKDALSEALAVDPQPALFEENLVARLDARPILEVSTEEAVAAFSAPPGRLSDFKWRRVQDQMAASDDEDETEEGRARSLRQGRKGRGGARREIYSAENEEWERKIRAEQKEKSKLQQATATIREPSPFEIQALKQEEDLRKTVQQRVKVFVNAADALVAVSKRNPEVAQVLADKVLPTAMSLAKSPLVGVSANAILDAYLTLVFSRDQRITSDIKTQLRKHERADPSILISLNDICKDTMEPLGKDLFELVFPIILRFASEQKSEGGELAEAPPDLEESSKDAITDAMFNLVSLHHHLINRTKRELLLPSLLGVVAETPLASSLDCVVSLFSKEVPSDKEIHVLVGDDGLLHKEGAVRLAALTALKRAQMSPLLSAYLWFASNDAVTNNRLAAEEALGKNSLDRNFYASLVPLLAHKIDHVRLQTARALAAGVDEHPDEANRILASVLGAYRASLDELRAALNSDKPQAKFFERGANYGSRKNAEPDPGWYQRSGVAFCLSAFAGMESEKPAAEDGEEAMPVLGPVFETEDALKAIEFVLADGTRDPHPTVRAQMISAGTSLLQAYGGDLGESLIALVQSYLDNKKASAGVSESELDRQKEGAVIFLGAAASNLSGDDDRVPGIARKLVEALDTPSETVQRAAVRILPQLMKNSRFKPENGGDGGRELVETSLNKTLSASSDFGSRKGNAMGLAAMIKGLGISSLKTFSIIPRLTEASASDRWEVRQGSLFCFDELTEALGRLFEPYVVQIVEPVLLKSFSDGQIDVRDAAHDASKKVMANMSGPGVSMLLPKLLSGITSTEWRTKQAAILMLGSVAFCAPKQLSSSLPQVVPKLIDAFTDTHPKVRAAAMSALKDVQSVVKNPEIEKISIALIGALTDPHERTKDAVDVLFQTRFVHAVDAPSLALLVPILRRGLKERSTETKKRAALIVGNMISMISDAKAVKPYLEDLMPVLKVVLVDPIPGVRGTAAKAMGTLVRGLGPEGIPDFANLFQFLITTMLQGLSSVERQGGAQGFVEVLVAMQDDEALETGLKKEIFDRAKDESVDPTAREGALWGLVFLPNAMENVAHYALDALLCSLNALADDTESVRDAALRCSRVYVAQFSVSNPEIVLTALESGLVHLNWRVRQTAVRLLADFINTLQKQFWKGPASMMTAPPPPAPVDIGDDEEEVEGDFEDEEEEEEEDKSARRGGNTLNTAVESSEAFSEGPVDSVLLKLFGADRRDMLIATVYLMRSDSASQVRQNALFVWKTMVSNTPRTMKRIIKPLMKMVVQHLSSVDPDRQKVGGRALGDVVKKLGDRVLPEIVPVVLRGLDSESEMERIGVAMGLFELVGATTKTHLEPQSSSVLEAVLKGLCDENSRVQEFAGKTFNRVHVLLGAQPDGPATTFVLTRLCERLDLDEESAVRGLTHAVEARSRDSLTFLLPRLLSKPLKACNLRALAACMRVVTVHLHHYLRQIVRSLVQELATLNLGPPSDTESEVWLACAACFSDSISEEQAVSTLLVELTDLTANATDAGQRRAAMSILQSFLANTEGVMDSELGAAVALKCTIRMFAEQDPAALSQAVSAFNALVKHVGAAEMAEHVDFMRNSIRTVASMDKHRPGVDKKPEYELPAFGMKPCVDALLEIYQYSLMNGSNEERESAAEGLGELVDLTYTETLKPYVVKITGPLIRIVGDRFPAPVKAAILDTLRKLLVKGGVVLRPFLPQLQTTFVKALQNTSESVRSCGFRALQVLVPLSPRVDPLCSELVQGCTGSDAEIRLQMVKALFFVLSSRLQDVSLAGLTKILEASSPVDACVSDWQDSTVRVVSAAVEAKAIEGVLRLSDNPESHTLLSSVLQRLSSRLSACHDDTKDTNVRHGALLALDALLRIPDGASLLVKHSIDPLPALEQAAGDEISSVRGVACDAAGWASINKSLFPRPNSFATMLQQASKSDSDSMVRGIAEFALRRSPDFFVGALDKMEAELS